MADDRPLGGLTVQNPGGVLTPHQHAVASEVLAAEGLHRRHVVIYLSGAHAYGFPSPDSDLDLKAVHAEPAGALLGLSPPTAHATRVEVVQGVEIDYTSNELGPVLAGVLGGNGNYIERFLGDLVLHETPALATLRPIIQRALSRRVHRHYRGFATQQRAAFEGAAHPSAKKLLYVLRTALTGTHLLRTGELVTDVTRLAAPAGFADVDQLIEAKRAGERVGLERTLVDQWRPRLDGLFALLDEAVRDSPLPAEPTNQDELDAWLVAHRLGEVP